MVLWSTQNQRCFNVKFLRWFNIDKLTLKYGYLFNVDIKILIFQASRYKSKIYFWCQPKINVVSTSNFDVDLTLKNWCCFIVEYGYLVNVNINALIFQASWHKNKIVFRVNTKSRLFHRWILSMNQRWQIDAESTWISRWSMSQRYFDIHQRWINVECLLGYKSRNL